jgi:hypothetical protein
MEVMAADPFSPAPPAAVTAAPEPPYHHPPADHPSTPPPKPSAAAAGAGLRTPSPSPSVQVSGYSLHELLLLSPPPPSSRRHRSRARGAAGTGTGLDESLEIVAVAGTPTPPRRRRRGAAEQCAAPALASPRNTRRARRRLEKDVEAEEDAARRARRRKSTRAAPKPAVAVDKAAAAVNEEDARLALVPACPDATRGERKDLSSTPDCCSWRNYFSECSRVYCSEYSPAIDDYIIGCLFQICWASCSNCSCFDTQELTSWSNLGGKVSANGLLSWWCGGTWLNRHCGSGLDLCSSSHAHVRERSPSGMWNFPALFTEIPGIIAVCL